jgi:hypothetical protein
MTRAPVNAQRLDCVRIIAAFPPGSLPGPTPDIFLAVLQLLNSVSNGATSKIEKANGLFRSPFVFQI